MTHNILIALGFAVIIAGLVMVLIGIAQAPIRKVPPPWASSTGPEARSSW